MFIHFFDFLIKHIDEVAEDFKTVHCLEETEPHFNLSAILSWKVLVDSRIFEV